MLYRYKPTGALLEKVSVHGDGIVMCTDSQDEVHYVNEVDLIPQLQETTEKVKTEERLTAQLASEGVKPATPTKKEIFPVDTRGTINTASARHLADAWPGVGVKTAREIKDLQSSMLGEKFIKLDQLKAIKRIDWDELIKDNLIRVE